MLNIKRLIITSAVSLGALFYLTVPQSSAKQIHPYQYNKGYVSQYNSVGRPLFGELKHSYGNWTFNGKSKLWNVPDNYGKRVPVMGTQQVRHIARHARHQRNPNYLFYLDYTATYKGRTHPTYYYIESYSEKVHGWIYHNGLVQAGRNSHESSNVLSPSEIYVPKTSHITKNDYANANDIKAELLGDLIKHDKRSYNDDLHYAKWEALNLGRIRYHTRKQKLQLVRRASREARTMAYHAKHSAKYKQYLIKQLI